MLNSDQNSTDLISEPAPRITQPPRRALAAPVLQRGWPGASEAGMSSLPHNSFDTMATLGFASQQVSFPMLACLMTQ